MWHLGDDIAIVWFKSKVNTIGAGRARWPAARHRRRRARMRGLVIWQTREPFSLGANLAIAPAVAGEAMGRGRCGGRASSSRPSMRLRTASCRRSRAVRGMALGGGCEFIMHCDRAGRRVRVLHRAGRGGRRACCPRAAAARSSRSARPRKRSAGPTAASSTSSLHAHVLPDVATAKVRRARSRRRSSATCAPSDIVVMHCARMLHVAKSAGAGAGRSRLPAAAAARATSRSPAGPGIATLKMMLVNMRDGGFIQRVRLRDRASDRARAVRR